MVLPDTTVNSVEMNESDHDDVETLDEYLADRPALVLTFIDVAERYSRDSGSKA